MTPKERAVMQQALEALESVTELYDDNAVGIEIEAITALREALKPTREGKYYYKDNACTADNADSPDCICWHDEALAEQAEQEPVGWNDLDDHELAEKLGWRIGDPLYMTAVGLGQEAIHHFKAKNTAPVRTKDLTDDEILDVALSIEIEFSKDTDKFVQQLEDIEVFARAIIAADREKNK